MRELPAPEKRNSPEEVADLLANADFDLVDDRTAKTASELRVLVARAGEP